MKSLLVWSITIAGTLGLFGSVACGDEPSADVAANVAASPAPTEWARVEGLRGQRYCEVLILHAIDGRLNADVWNTFGYNDCPQADWEALDVDAIKAGSEGALFVLLNGPRYWLMDAIEKQPAGERQVRTFGALEMFLAATVDLGPIPPNLAPYTERHVDRETVFEFAAGSQVYEIVDGTGRVFIMQSYSQQSDAALAEAALATLGERLKLPQGWTYRARILDEELDVLTPGDTATVIQDDFSNTYQLIESAQ